LNFDQGIADKNCVGKEEYVIGYYNFEKNNEPVLNSKYLAYLVRWQT